MHHWVRDCPNRQFVNRPPATGANAVPTGGALLALPALNPPSSSTAPSNSYAAVTSNPPSVTAPGNFNHGNQGRPNWWTRNQERLDKVYNKYVEDMEKEASQKAEQEKERVKKEEEENKLLWKKEREQLEVEMGPRLDKRFEALGLTRSKKTDGVTPNGGVVDELLRLRKENEELRSKIGAWNGQSNDEKVRLLQNEIQELRRQTSNQQTNEDTILALKTEIGELKQSAYVKTNFEQEIVGLRMKISTLRGQNEAIMGEVNQWKSEALCPGNKRGSIAVGTPEPADRGTPKPRSTDNLREADKWKDEYNNLCNLHRIANLEVDAIKKKRAEAELKRMEVEKQVKELEERMSELTASGVKTRGGGTNLKERLEEVAVRSTRKGQKATPMRFGGVSAVGNRKTTEGNNRAEYIEEQKSS
ncbi:hypothetical protein CBR_g19754 [Chara braunii]|uniref:Uncharacterized protein n=1 Tax=Chara braunii TaxID=69332 RepID=A0A388JTV0_CHABU|nr:hypothetical protein CBR_g19754 [Chara braunii]|eukprot:GBG61221.1 hypothetical protein CBR_g19754 [Chara braunii]